mmetsp:Transcript_14163/g.25079  ORF Transcript_14163/g.25079 Transcript_14163/m.25079 type:complete len:92 (-) Transcript_14163:316-591(-)|eukprot:CAMPEP_0177772988 /NCGR_PEP_ID=MMETSP0491_2-20121128/12577_1 /TAXON_ID=63592 /ORGANISM="Tetraselmis chuii, Strain PLY429" /LENGTH=91 /DNA_ID=CAMNT_0019290957 /DNA_START=314 /DNA_END=589 /DNA_ORIENTATION=-
MRVVWLGAALAAFLSAWLAALNLELDSGARPIVQLSPVLAVLLFGLYCVLALAHGVLTFRSCPEEHESLQRDIKEARAELRKLNVLDDGEE